MNKLIKQKYIAVRVDQDKNPDISNCYEDYSWPATYAMKYVVALANAES